MITSWLVCGFFKCVKLITHTFSKGTKTVVRIKKTKKVEEDIDGYARKTTANKITCMMPAYPCVRAFGLAREHILLRRSIEIHFEIKNSFSSQASHDKNA